MQGQHGCCQWLEYFLIAAAKYRDMATCQCYMMAYRSQALIAV